METQDYRSSITANIPPRKAFESIGHVSEWWAKNFEGKAQEPGDVFTVRFGETFVTFRIAELVPDKKIVWEVIDCHLHWLSDKKEWKGTKMIWEVLVRKDGTQVNFTHVGLVPEIECYDDCSTGWNFYIKESLFKFITEGKGLPETPRAARN